MLVLSLQDDRDNRLYDLRTMLDTHITIRVNCALKSRTKERKYNLEHIEKHNDAQMRTLEMQGLVHHLISGRTLTPVFVWTPIWMCHTQIMLPLPLHFQGRQME